MDSRGKCIILESFGHDNDEDLMLRVNADNKNLDIGKRHMSDDVQPTGTTKRSRSQTRVPTSLK